MTHPETVVLDLDGTLVDSVHSHVLAWQWAFRDVGVHVPGARIHRLIGMGGDRLVTQAAGQALEDRLGDEVRARHRAWLDTLVDRIIPTDGAERLLETLGRHHLRVVLASSADGDLTERLLALVPGTSRLEVVITGSDADASKPDGELVSRAMAAVDARDAVMVGDAVWDVHSADDAGVRCIGLLTGGISEAELRDAGAVAVHESPATLAAHLDDTGSLLD